ncbi:LacI family DNA-binding transcriptional regulator [Actinoplanes sp. CA-131856]
MPERDVTMESIAQAAGVSVPTVSRVLSGRGQVSPATRERDLRLLAERDYRPRRARRARTGLIQVVFPGLSCGWEMEHLRGIEAVVQEAGVGLVVSALRRGDFVRTDGAILASTSGARALTTLLDDFGVPSVALDPATGTAAGLPTVGAANWQGARSATRHLAGLGHRRIAFVAGSSELMCTRARIDGYRAGLEEAGLAAVIEHGSYSYDSGLVAAKRLLEGENRPTAVVASSDNIALGVLDGARRLGFDVPGDLSVTGFDDLPASRWSSPPLTTVRQPLREMGRLAGRTILRLLDGKPVEWHHAELGTELIVRASTAPPR